MTKNMRKVCQLNRNSLKQALSSSLNVQTSGFLASFVRNSSHKAERIMWSFKDKVLVLNPLHFSVHYFSYLPNDPYRSF